MQYKIYSIQYTVYSIQNIVYSIQYRVGGVSPVWPPSDPQKPRREAGPRNTWRGVRGEGAMDNRKLVMDIDN